MSLDLAVLRVIKRKEQFDKVNKFIDGGLDDNTQTMVNCFRVYFDTNPDDDMIDMDIFRHLFYNKWFPNLTAETREVYSRLIDRICDDVTLEQQASIVNSLVENNMVTLIANDIDEYQQSGEFDIVERVAGRHSDAKKLLEVVATCDYATVDTLNDKPCSRVSFKWPMQALAETCRPIEGGDNIAVVALTDVGKTALTLQFAVSMARQTDMPILWFNNEGPRERIQYRMYGMMLGCTFNEVKRMQEEGTLQAALMAQFGRPDPVRVYDIHLMTTRQLEELIRNVNDDVGVGAVIWDMISNVQLVDAASYSRDDKVMEAKYQFTRMLGSLLDFPNLMTCQQSHNKEWKQWPSKHELMDSKIAVQGACDMILFATQPEEAAKETFRYLSAPKNKLSIPGAPTLRAEVRYHKLMGVFYEE